MVPTAAAERYVTMLTAVALDEFATPQDDLVMDIFAIKNTLAPYAIFCIICYNFKTKYKTINLAVPFQRKSTSIFS